MKRRDVMRNMSLAAGAMLLSKEQLMSRDEGIVDQNYGHSVCRWCFNGIKLEELCEAAQQIGIKSIEIIGPDDWEVIANYDLTCAMGNAPFISLTEGINNPANHAKLQAGYPDLLRKAADKGIPNIIVFSGNRNGLSAEEGLENCARGLEPLVKVAEEVGVMLSMELLNSKVNHPDYQCDHTEWGVKLVEKVGSPQFKLLYDIYHMQVMEGDVIATIKKYSDHICHYHTAGVPGRNEIDESQELNYPAIMKAIQETGYQGWVAQEFIPKREDKIASLRQGVEICSI